MHADGSPTALYDLAPYSARLPAPLLLLYVGDWDPSGLHMSEVDLPARLDEYGAHAEVRRVALSAEDVTYGGLPSFSAESKRADSRWAWYVQHHGQQCW